MVRPADADDPRLRFDGGNLCGRPLGGAGARTGVLTVYPISSTALMLMLQAAHRRSGSRRGECQLPMELDRDQLRACFPLPFDRSVQHTDCARRRARRSAHRESASLGSFTGGPLMSALWHDGKTGSARAGRWVLNAILIFIKALRCLTAVLKIS